MPETIRWGILGTGKIAHKFAEALAVVPDAELSAVGSRAQGTADTFGDEFEVPRRHPSYASLAEDPEIDAIYVSSPHPMHCRDTLLCLNADKPVLCEKPFALNASEAEAMIR
ncbi:MAG: Gfo/Idh/MocA family oxidoreductase, partial [Gemmatimonadota bacterium]|nr:Gfo/Idh/MocA family oxidoreductase [Gemmatimonadota bacterium]